MIEWHAVKSRPGAEGRAFIGIQACGMPGFLPVCRVHKEFRHYREVGWESLFDGYLFVKCDAALDLPDLLAIKGVEDVLREKIPEEVIEAIRIATDHGVFDKGHRKTRFSQGDDVISTGPLGKLVAKIKSARPSRRMELLTNFPFRVTVGAENVEKVA
jgi:hypothetical protein